MAPTAATAIAPLNKLLRVVLWALIFYGGATFVRVPDHPPRIRGVKRRSVAEPFRYAGLE